MKKLRLIFVTLIFFAIFLNGMCTNKKDTISNNSTNTTSQIIKDISAEDANVMINENKKNPNFSLLDVRTDTEFKEKHIENAINIDFYLSNFKEELNKLDKNKKYVIYCRSGHRSGQTLSLMKDLGFKEVYNVQGGINIWQSKNLPIVK